MVTYIAEKWRFFICYFCHLLSTPAEQGRTRRDCHLPGRPLAEQLPPTLCATRTRRVTEGRVMPRFPLGTNFNFALAPEPVESLPAPEEITDPGGSEHFLFLPTLRLGRPGFQASPEDLVSKSPEYVMFSQRSLLCPVSPKFLLVRACS